MGMCSSIAKGEWNYFYKLGEYLSLHYFDFAIRELNEIEITTLVSK
jgi:hypothetical protein